MRPLTVPKRMTDRGDDARRTLVVRIAVQRCCPWPTYNAGIGTVRGVLQTVPISM